MLKTHRHTHSTRKSDLFFGGDNKPRKKTIGIFEKTTFGNLTQTVSFIPGCDMTLRILNREIVPVAGGRVVLSGLHNVAQDLVVRCYETGVGMNAQFFCIFFLKIVNSTLVLKNKLAVLL